MYQLLQSVESLARRDEGQDLLEYALLIALVAITCVGGITFAGNNVSGVVNQIANAI